MTPNSSTALITGGTSGIGLATARKLAQLGIHVLVVGRNAERGKTVVDEIRAAGGQVDFIPSDLHDLASVRTVAKKAIELGDGQVDILINNVGIFPFGPTHEMTEEQFDRVFSINVKVPYFLVAELAPLMAGRGKGAIVNISTMVADYGAPGMSLYSSSKAAINLLTRTWAAEYGPKGVRVNAVSPGPTRTEGTEAMGEALNSWLPRDLRAVQLQPMKSRRQLFSSRPIVPVSSMEQSSLWTAGALRSEPRQSCNISMTLSDPR
jgi:NAD(P)-dependent dehydrogenase (short-subunit alcohol dehydrogenase family)